MNVGNNAMLKSASATSIAPNPRKLPGSIRMVLALGLMGAAFTASASCKTDAIGCSVNTGGMLLACAAATAALGSQPVFDYACYLEAAGVVGSCNAMAESCIQDTTSNNALTTSAGLVGSATGTKQTFTCGTASGGGSGYVNRVNGIYAKKMLRSGDTYYLVSSIRMDCTKGSATFVGNNGVDGTTWSGGKCANGKLAAGVSFRAGSWVDAIGRICDTVSTSSGTSDNTVSTPSGDPDGGDRIDKLCPEGKYLFGLNVWYDATLPLASRFVRGVEPLCRGYS
jgi:hypothetical protein